MTQLPPTRPERVEEVRKDGKGALTKEIANEVAVSLSYNGVAHVVMFMSPQDIEDFVVGFSLSEGVIEKASDLISLELLSNDLGLLASAEISKEHFENVVARRRNLPGQSGCGICGVVELESAMRDLPKVAAQSLPADAAVFKALDHLTALQPLNQMTRAVHGAAFVSPEGEILAVREDIGRHNALDKLVGHLARQGLRPEDGFLLMTSRASVELVQKAVVAGFPLMVTISAPTSLAVDLAREANMSLVCVARSDGMLYYHVATPEDKR